VNFESLKKEIVEIAEIAEKVPESFREKCFELLLNHLLQTSAKGTSGSTQNNAPAAQHAADADTSTAKINANGSLTLPAGIKAFMRRATVSQEEIESVVMIDDGEFHFIKQPSHSNVSKGQNEWALLLALKNGIVSGSLVVDAEAVRSVVQDQGFYDKANFAKNFKSAKYSSWYRDSIEAQGSPVGLSAEGETQLAALIKSL
jgi:hypothetical protein